HGATMAGARDPGILSYIRYHTDAEATAQIRQKHPTLPLTDDLLKQIVADTRVLAGTNPAMSTSGFTGRRGGPGGGGAAPARGAAPASAAPAPAPAAAPATGGGRGQAPAAGMTPMRPSTMQPVTIAMVDGKTRTGILLGRTDL